MSSPSDKSSLKPAQPFRVFISYARKDITHLESLKTHLANLTRQGWTEPWSDKNLYAGDAWEKVLLHQLRTADIVILLVSADFNASDFIQEKELPRIIKRHRREEIRVVPIIVRPADTKGSYADSFQCLPLDDHRQLKPITEWDNPDRAWLTVVEELRAVLEVLQRTQVHRKRSHRATTATLGAIGLGVGALGMFPTELEMEVWAVAQPGIGNALTQESGVALASSPYTTQASAVALRPLSQAGPVYHNETLLLYSHVSMDVWGLLLTERRSGGIKVLLPSEGNAPVRWHSGELETAEPLGQWPVDASPGEERLLIVAAQKPEPVEAWLQTIRALETRAQAGGWDGDHFAAENLEPKGIEPPCPGGRFPSESGLVAQLLICFPETQENRRVGLSSQVKRPVGARYSYASQAYTVSMARDRTGEGLVWVWLQYDHLDSQQGMERDHALQ